MTPSQVSVFIVIAASPGVANGADADRTRLEDGAYHVSYRLELPHVQLWGSGKTTTICLPVSGAPDELPLPVLSGNNPFSQCSAADVRSHGSSLTFAIRCKGRDAASARARFTVGVDGFEGRIAMIMGAKNMTMTEVQVGRRVGSCSLTSAGR